MVFDVTRKSDAELQIRLEELNEQVAAPSNQSK